MATRKTTPSRAKRKSTTKEAEKGVRAAQKFMESFLAQVDPPSVRAKGKS